VGGRGSLSSMPSQRQLYSWVYDRAIGIRSATISCGEAEISLLGNP
jgi:hypothetical protein